MKILERTALYVSTGLMGFSIGLMTPYSLKWINYLEKNHLTWQYLLQDKSIIAFCLALFGMLLFVTGAMIQARVDNKMDTPFRRRKR